VPSDHKPREGDGPSPTVDPPEPEVMASVDDAPGTPEFVIADVSTEDAWVSIRCSEAPALDDWR